MEKKEAVHDPLMYGEPEEDPDSPMEDLTQHLESSRLIGDLPYPDPVHTHPDPMAPAVHKALNPLESPKDSPKSPEAFATYGGLANPPSYEDSMMFPPPQPPQPSPAAAPTPSTSTSANLPAPSALSPTPSGGLPDQGRPSEGLPDVPPAGPPSQEAPLQVAVSEPVKKEQQGGLFGLKGGYVAYRVSTRTTLTHFRAREFSVRRRFKEVVELASILRERFRGYFLPPRPEKNAVEGQRMKEAFVEERRLALERYLQQLAAHPAISRSQELRLFLEVEGELAQCGAWLALLPSGGGLFEGTAKLGRQLTGREGLVLDPAEASKPNKKAGNLVRAVKESVQGLKAVPSLDPEEVALRRQRDNLEALRDALTASSRAAESVVGCGDKVGAVLGDLALAMLHVSKFEESNGGPLAKYTGTLRYCATLVADCKKAAAACLKLSKLSRTAAARTAQTLEPLHHFLAFMPNALRAFGSREHQLLTQQTLEADLEARRRGLAEAEAAGKNKRAGELKEEAARLEQAIVAARQEYNKIKAANTSELDRFQGEQRAALSTMLRNLTVLQAAAAQRQTELWLQAAQDLGASPDELAAVTGPGGVVQLPSASSAGPSTSHGSS